MTFRFVFLGLSTRSSWGSAYATTYQPLLRALVNRGHEVVFLERDQPVYADNHDIESFAGTDTHVYGSIAELHDRFAATVADADLVVVGSFVPDGIEVSRWALDVAPGGVAFYDIDTPVTLSALIDGTCTYLSPELIPRYALYLSVTGGPTLEVLRRTYGADWVRPLYSSVDPDVHFPEATDPTWDLGYLVPQHGDRADAVERLLVEPARAWRDGRFLIAGAKLSEEREWPDNVERRALVARTARQQLYALQRFTLNVSRRTTVAEGWSPNIGVFEAAACGTPIISEPTPGLDELLLPSVEVFLVRTAAEVLSVVREVPEAQRARVAKAARSRMLAEHTCQHRAETLERYTRELLERRTRRSRVTVKESAHPYEDMQEAANDSPIRGGDRR